MNGNDFALLQEEKAETSGSQKRSMGNDSWYLAWCVVLISISRKIKTTGEILLLHHANWFHWCCSCFPPGYFFFFFTHAQTQRETWTWLQHHNKCQALRKVLIGRKTALSIFWSDSDKPKCCLKSKCAEKLTHSRLIRRKIMITIHM